MNDEPSILPSRRWRPWKIALCLAAIFLAGALCGAAISVRVVRHRVQALRLAGPEGWTRLVLDRLERRLKLTPEQRRTLTPTVRAGIDEMREVRNRAAGEVAAIVQRTRDAAAPTLTAEQRRQLDETMRDNARRARRWVGRRAP